jgi:DNA-binding LacI/PurR family transcriptional regulator
MPHQTHRVTRLKDVARLAGASTATASRILNERGPASFDDFRSAAVLTPPLSVVEQHPMGIGAEAHKELARVIESGQPSEPISLIPTRLVIRASCGCRTNPG